MAKRTKLSTWIALGIVLAPLSWAAPPTLPPLEPPKQPVPPPPDLGVKKPPETFSCERQFRYRGKLLACDSKLSADGENLRAVIDTVPQALAELDEYQANRKRIQGLAYVGTVGLTSILTGVLFSKKFTHSAEDARRLRKILVLGGAGLVGSSVLIGVSILQANGRHLDNAVRMYNEAKPMDRIELQFTTGFTF